MDLDGPAAYKIEARHRPAFFEEDLSLSVMKYLAGVAPGGVTRAQQAAAKIAGVVLWSWRRMNAGGMHC